MFLKFLSICNPDLQTKRNVSRKRCKYKQVYNINQINFQLFLKRILSITSDLRFRKSELIIYKKIIYL